MRIFKSIIGIVPVLGLFVLSIPPLKGQDGESSADTLLGSHLKTAAENNPALIASYKDYQSALERVPQVGTLPDPEVSFGYFVSPPETRVGPQIATFSVSQMFPWNGTLNSQSEVAALKAKARFKAFQAKKAELFYKVRHTWYSLYDKRKEVELTQKNLETLRSWEKLALQKYETGKGSMVDVLRIRMEIRRMNDRLSFLQDELKPLKTRFNSLLGRQPGDSMEAPTMIPLKELPLEDEALRDSIIARDPSLQRLDLREKAAEESVVREKKYGKPSFGIGLNYTVVGERSDASPADNGKDIFMPMLKLRLPLYRKKYRSGVKEAQLQQERFRSLKEDHKNQLATMTDNAYVAYDDARRRIDLYKAQIEDAKKARSILIQEFTNGKEDFEEVLRIQRLLYEYQWKLEQARADQNKAVAKFQQLLTR